MDNNKFEKLVRKVVAEHHNRNYDPGVSQIDEDDVFIVWSCKTLQNNKALASAKDKHELYVDAHVISLNVCIKNTGQSI